MRCAVTALVLLAAGAEAQSVQRIEIVDHGIYTEDRETTGR